MNRTRSRFRDRAEALPARDSDAQAQAFGPGAQAQSKGLFAEEAREQVGVLQKCFAEIAAVAAALGADRGITRLAGGEDAQSHTTPPLNRPSPAPPP